tara:strand:- start:33565 stop:33897 length:333 start_codon:yes stop_codon:yes gene_type:complete
MIESKYKDLFEGTWGTLLEYIHYKHKGILDYIISEDSDFDAMKFTLESNSNTNKVEILYDINLNKFNLWKRKDRECYDFLETHIIFDKHIYDNIENEVLKLRLINSINYN